MKEYLFKQNLPPKKFASDLKISVSYLYQLLRGERKPSLELAQKIEAYTKGEAWLEKINPSAAESLREDQEELLTFHRLEVPPLLRKTVQTTNPIESMFSSSSHVKRNLKNLKKGEQPRHVKAYS